jgi:site-specific DNA-cytosine methylase
MLTRLSLAALSLVQHEPMSPRHRSLQRDLLSNEPRCFSDPESWVSWLHEQLPQPAPTADAPLVVDLFAGCGGLSLGFEVAGFRTVGYEMKSFAAASYNANLSGRCIEQTLRVGDPAEISDVDIVIGGPPCQPFSQIGYQRGVRDPRDGFPIFLDAVLRMRPRIAIIENVRGLLFRNKDYLRATASELERFGYQVDARLLDTSHYGVPQKRERVVIVASRVGWSWPTPVVDAPVTVGTALGPLAQEVRPESKFLTDSMDRYIAKYEAASHCIRPRDLHLNQVSRTVTCRNLGGGTADMLRIRLPDGRRRMLHDREAARLMSFPDWFSFYGRAYDRSEQIGNAVAPLLSLALAKKALEALSGVQIMSQARQGRSKLLSKDPIQEKIEQALALLAEAGLELRELTARRRQRAALCLLALSQIKPGDTWQDAKSHVENNTVPALRSREILSFRNNHYSEGISSGSYDDVRRKDLELLSAIGLVQARANKEDADTNDGTRGYALTMEALALLRAFRMPTWEAQLRTFREQRSVINDRLSKARFFNMIRVTLSDGTAIDLGGGAHNEIQKQVIEQFLPRFAPGSRVLYFGDSSKKDLHVDEPGLQSVGLNTPARGQRLPDIVAHDVTRNWLFLIEAVHSSNPIDEQRHQILRQVTEKHTTAGRVYVTAFLNRKSFAKWLGSNGIAWETEVWCADQPDHCAHFDGIRFLGPYEEQ